MYILGNSTVGYNQWNKVYHLDFYLESSHYPLKSMVSVFEIEKCFISEAALNPSLIDGNFYFSL